MYTVGFLTSHSAVALQGVSLAEATGRMAEAGTDKRSCPAVVVASLDRSEDYSKRTGLQCPEIDALKGTGKSLDYIWNAMELSPYVALLKLSHSSEGIHPFVAVQPQGDYTKDWNLAADWACAVTGGLSPDTAMRSPKQLIYMAHSEKVVLKEDVTSLGNSAGWEMLASKVRIADPDSDMDVLATASAYKTYADMLGGMEAAVAALIAFCSRSEKYATAPPGYAEDKYERAETWAGAKENGPKEQALEEHSVAYALSDILRYNVEQQRPEIQGVTGIWHAPTEIDTETLLSRALDRTGVKLNRSLVGPMYNAVGLYNSISPFEDYIRTCYSEHPFTTTEALLYLHGMFFHCVWGYSLDDPFYEWLAMNWPGHLVGNFLDTDGPRPTYSILLYGDQRIGKDQSILQLVPSELSSYVLESQFGNAKEVAMASSGRVIMLMPELGLGDQRTISMAKFKLLVTNLPGYRRLYSPITQAAPTGFFFVFTVNPTEMFLLEPSQMSSRLPAVAFNPKVAVSEFVAQERDRFWAAAYATKNSPALLPKWMSDESHKRFPASPDTPLNLVLQTLDIVPGRSYSVRELIAASAMGDSGPIKHDLTRAVRAELERQGWSPMRGGYIECPKEWENPYA